MTQEELLGAARKTTETVTDAARDALEAAKSGVTDTAAALCDAAEARIDAGKDMIADEAKRLAKGLRAAAGDQDNDSLPNRILETVASSVADLSEGLRGRSLGTLLGEAEGLARRNPGTFVAAAGLAGFALARFALASSPGANTGRDDNSRSDAGPISRTKDRKPRPRS